MNIKSGAGVVHKYTICTRKFPFEKVPSNNSWPLFIPKILLTAFKMSHLFPNTNTNFIIPSKS